MTEAALLAAILADPADDMPRLILADWWDENGQSEWAEFCRVQCALETLQPVQENWERVQSLRRREREIAATQAAAWIERILDGG